jgi:PucR-like helix-turn-helix protein
MTPENTVALGTSPVRVFDGTVIGLRWVLDALGSGLLEPASDGADPAVQDVVVAEPGEGGDPLHPGDLVLGVGVQDEAAAAELAVRAGRAGAAAVLLRTPAVHAGAVRQAAAEAGVALVAVRGRVSWAQLVWLLRSVVDTGSVGVAGAAAEPAAFHDLFALADAAAAVIDAPVTIEDEYSRVLAYSRRQEHVDAARLSTIVGRRVPADVLRSFRSRGVFRQLGSGTEPIFVPGQPDGTKPRLIVPVRVGGSLLGSIWALVADRPSDERIDAFADTASVVALHLLRVRAAADVAGRVAAERLRAALSGTRPVDGHEVELPAAPYRVVALGAGGPESRPEVPSPGRHASKEPGPPESRIEGAGTSVDHGDVPRLAALWESMARGRGWHRPAVTELDGQLYAVVAAAGSTAGTWDWLRRLATDLLRAEPGVLAAAGGTADTLADLPRSAAQAAALLRLVRDGVVAGPVAGHDEAWAVVLLDRVTGAVPLAELLGPGPLTDLLAADSSRGGWYAATLRAELEHPGDPGAASRALHVHPNTFRYRMRRVRAALPADLDSPDVRLALLIQLSARRLHG